MYRMYIFTDVMFITNIDVYTFDTVLYCVSVLQGERQLNEGCVCVRKFE